MMIYFAIPTLVSLGALVVLSLYMGVAYLAETIANYNKNKNRSLNKIKKD